MSQRSEEYFIVVIEEIDTRQIVAVGTLVIEKKLYVFLPPYLFPGG